MTTRYVAIFPIHAPAPDARHHRAALNQLHTIVPDTVTITGAWTGHTWTDPDRRQWYVISAPAEGTDSPALVDAVQATAHHIDPVLEAWTRGEYTPPPPPAPVVDVSAHAPSKPRLERLADLLAAGTSVEDAYRACGWVRARSAANAARRAGNITLARTLEAVSNPARRAAA